MGKLIGVFATDIASRVQGKLYRTLFEDYKSRGYTLVFFSAELNRSNFKNTDDSAFYLIELAEKMDFSALLLHVESLQNPELIHAIINMGKQKDIPVFLYDCKNYGYSSKDGVITINPDYKQGFSDSINHLIEHHNCKNIYMLAGTKGNLYSEERIAMYRQAMMAHELPFSEEMVAYGDFWEGPAIKAVNEILDKVERGELPVPEAICSANDSMAIAAAKVLNQRGYRIPEDILMTGFDGIDDGKFHSPAISTCEPVLDDLSDYITNAIENNIRCDEYNIPLRFIPKESCACDNSYKAGDAQELTRIMENVRQNGWQHSMISNLQLSLMNSCDIESLFHGMFGTVRNFRGVSLLYCIREDLERQTDFTSGFDRLKIRLNFDFLENKEYESFTVGEIIPDYRKIAPAADGNEFFVFQMLNSNRDQFGYSIIKSDHFVSNEMRIFSQFGESFTNMLESVLRNIRLEQANKKLNEMYEKVSEMYIRDVMTGLFNRTGYYQELENYLNREDIKQGYLHVVSLDMDGLKFVNDNFGHQEGDNAIRAVAKTIKDCFAQPCIAARFGGDEFVVALFTKSKYEPSQSQVSERLNNYLSILPELREKTYTVGISVGHSVVKISQLEDINTLEKLADESMYINKRERKNN